MERDNATSPAPRPPLTAGQLRLPDGMNFSCHYCGRCCQDFWEIPLDARSLARLESLPLERISPNFTDAAHYTEPSVGQPGELAFARTETGRCIFLDADLRCVIHSHFGPAAKAQTCTDFPFRYICTPRGVFLGLSMACPSVRANRGQPLALWREHLLGNFHYALSVVTIADPVELSPGLPISFDAYEQIESCLIELLRIETLSLDDRLIAGNVFLQILERAVREVGLAPVAATAGPPRAAASASQIEPLIQAFRQDGFRRILTIARKARGSARLHRAVIGSLLTYRSAFDATPRGRIGQTLRLLYQYFRHLGGLGSLAMPPLAGRLTLSRLRGLSGQWDDPEVVGQFQRFCSHSLFRKDAIVATPLLRGYSFLLLYVALIRWYARAHAAAGGKPRVEPADVDEAIGTVEKYYCLHTGFMRLFDRYWLLNSTIERLVVKPHFAPSLVRPKGP